MFQLKRRYPVGIQTFSEIINRGCVYVDKTDLMWQVQDAAKYIFLSRPRRFGKSLLTTTFKSFFEGRRDLFEGLKVMELETEWMEYPVIHLDLSMAKGANTVEQLKDNLYFLLEPYVKVYNTDKAASPGKQLTAVLRAAHGQEGKQVVLLIDEYDAPLLDVLHTDEQLAAFRHVMQEFYQTLKASEAMIRFCFITGITRFSQVSIFSTLNNLMNITMYRKYANICGITETELHEQLGEDVALLAEENNCTVDDMYQRLRQHYDGYHFTENSEGLYNPYSLFNAFMEGRIKNYWFESGTPTYLIEQLKHFKTDITTLDDFEVPDSSLQRPTQTLMSALPLLFQAGYLTIKGYDPETYIYNVAIPNQEVRIGLTEALLPAYSGLNVEDVQDGFAARFWRSLKRNDLDLALREMQAYIAGLPYIEGFKKKLDDVAKAEGFYEWTFYLIFSMLNAYVRTQVKTIRGRADVVVRMPDATYVFELKINGTAHEALQQINSQGYAIPYQTDGLPIYKVGIRFSTETLSIEEWEIGV
ncbi:MAG: ATP-binding protein [Bacteroidaceae bacterium]|nr:ATP-binding protein [Bacteroidaceae bacterium]